ncbi:hypothetical protein EV648_1191, partial [Kribbella sp. VKM Ac-2568]
PEPQPGVRRGRVPGRRRRPVGVEDSRAVQVARAALVKAEQRHAERDARLREQERAAAKKPSKGQPRRNVTDPDSRIMPTRKGWIQGYNAQLAVTDDHLILAATLTQDTTDTDQAIPMMTAATNAAAILQAHRPPTCHTEPAPQAGQETHSHHGINLILFDAGYLSENNLTAEGPDRLIALGKHRDQTRAATTNPTSGPPPANTTATAQMRHRLQTPKHTKPTNAAAPPSKPSSATSKTSSDSAPSAAAASKPPPANSTSQPPPPTSSNSTAPPPAPPNSPPGNRPRARHPPTTQPCPPPTNTIPQQAL